MTIKPLADRVLITTAAAEEVTLGGIIIPDSAKEKPLKGTVTAVGNGTKDEEMVVKVGDTVLYGRDDGAPHHKPPVAYRHQGKPYMLGRRKPPRYGVWRTPRPRL